MLDQMIRYVRGYVRIRVSGRFAERFFKQLQPSQSPALGT